MSASLNSLPFAETFRHRDKLIASGTVQNIRREQKASGRFHVDTDVNAVLTEYAQEVFSSPPGCFIHAAIQDEQENDAIAAAIRHKLAMMTVKKPENAPKQLRIAHIARCRQRLCIGAVPVLRVIVAYLSPSHYERGRYPVLPRRVVWKPSFPMPP